MPASATGTVFDSTKDLDVDINLIHRRVYIYVYTTLTLSFRLVFALGLYAGIVMKVGGENEQEHRCICEVSERQSLIIKLYRIGFIDEVTGRHTGLGRDIQPVYGYSPYTFLES